MSNPLQLHSHQVQRTARYATLGAPQSARSWWVVLHGYGQLARDFVEAFAPVVTPHRCVVAPEGLSRFYVDEGTEHQQVGASWMTREAREAEIADYVDALDATVRDLADGAPPPPLFVLGFSQGAATATRWAVMGDTAVDRLVLWGAPPAHDLALTEHTDALRSVDLTLVAGTQDPHLPPDRRSAVRERLRRLSIPVSVHTFDGGHRLDVEILRTLAENV